MIACNIQRKEPKAWDAIEAKIMLFQSTEQAKDFARNLCVYLGKEVRLSFGNVSSQGYYFHPSDY